MEAKFARVIMIDFLSEEVLAEDQNRYVVKVLFNLSSEAEPQELETYFERV